MEEEARGSSSAIAPPEAVQPGGQLQLSAGTESKQCRGSNKRPRQPAPVIAHTQQHAAASLLPLAPCCCTVPVRRQQHPKPRCPGAIPHPHLEVAPLAAAAAVLAAPLTKPTALDTKLFTVKAKWGVARQEQRRLGGCLGHRLRYAPPQMKYRPARLNWGPLAGVTARAACQPAYVLP